MRGLYMFLYTPYLLRCKAVYTTRLVIKWPFLKYIVDQASTEECYPRASIRKRLRQYENVMLGKA